VRVLIGSLLVGLCGVSGVGCWLVFLCGTLVFAFGVCFVVLVWVVLYGGGGCGVRCRWAVMRVVLLCQVIFDVVLG